jgi:hypothetical protein
MANPMIGLVTSTTFDPILLTEFKNGLQSTGTPPWVIGTNVDLSPLKEADGQYDNIGGDADSNTKLYDLVDSFNTVNDVKLVVAVGGLVAAHAAVKKANKPYLLLVGRVPSDFPLDNTVPRFCGGVNLNIVASNEQRGSELARIFSGAPFSVTADTVALIYNPNSRMGRLEARKWKRNSGGNKRPVAPAGIDDDGDFDNNKLEKFFRRGFAKAVAGGATAFVISADPFFNDQKEKLVNAANSAGRPICYPFVHYGLAPNQPSPIISRWLGPDLKAVYRKIGMQAGVLLTAIQGGASLPFDFVTVSPSSNTADSFPVMIEGQIGHEEDE